MDLGSIILCVLLSDKRPWMDHDKIIWRSLSVFTRPWPNWAKLQDDKKARIIPLMLSEDAVIYYSSQMKQYKTYKDAIGALPDWYRNSDGRSKILTKWQSMWFTEENGRNSKNSEVEVFRTFVAKLMSPQKQLGPSYHRHRFLRDWLMTTIEIPPFQILLWDRIPIPAQQLANLIANSLSEKPKTAVLA